MCQIDRDVPQEFAANRDSDLARALTPGLLTYEQFLGKHTDRMPL